MSKVLLDTSSLMALALAQEYRGTPSKDSHALWQAHGGIDTAIEAILLYDELLVDAPSFHRNLESTPGLQSYARFCGEIRLSIDDEQQVYKIVLDKCVKHLAQPSADVSQVFRMHTEKWMAAELGVHYYPSAQWSDIEDQLTGEAASVATQIRARFGDSTPYSGAACLTLLRTFYYDVLQQLAGVDLILHPLKGTFFTSELSSGLNILTIFDESVRREFETRRRKWLARSEVSVQIPLLTSYVLNRCKVWRDLPKVIEEVRESTKARNFRSGLQEFIQAAESHDNLKCDGIMSELAAACDAWSKSLRQEGLKKKISVSIPLINIGTELEIPDLSLTKSPGQQMLVFIHELLRRA